MSFTLDWDTQAENTLVITKTEQDNHEFSMVLATFEKAFEMITESGKASYIIFDVRMFPHPPAPRVLTKMSSVFQKAPPHLENIIMVGGDRLAKTSMNILGSVVLNGGILTLDTMDEAYEHITTEIALKP